MRLIDSAVTKISAPGTALLADGRIALVVNCPRGRGPRADGDYIRSAAGANRIPLLTTAAAAVAAAEGIRDRDSLDGRVRSLQSFHRED